MEKIKQIQKKLSEQIPIQDVFKRDENFNRVEGKINDILYDSFSKIEHEIKKSNVSEFMLPSLKQDIKNLVGEYLNQLLK